tara:strand:+ start:39 stop:416 length:378 start_codon:yes stop_codon:yes gene_type:complete
MTATFQTTREGSNVKSIEFEDVKGNFHSRITFEQAAKLVKKERKLTTGPYIDREGLRSARAILENHTPCDKCIEPIRCYTPNRERRLYNRWWAFCLDAECDRQLVSTPEELCTRIVVWLRGFKRK